MIHLRRYNESNGKVHNPTLEELLKLLQDAIKEYKFEIRIGGGEMDNYSHLKLDEVSNFDRYYLDADDTYIEINKLDEEGGTYLDFTLSDFSIKELRGDCNLSLDDDKSNWGASEETKDLYDILCQSILVTLDNVTGEINKGDFGKISSEWSDICNTLGVKMSEDTYHRVKRLMDRYNITKK